MSDIYGLNSVRLNNQLASAYNCTLKSYEISAPKVKTKFVDVPGRSGSIDFTEFLGYPTFDDKTITINFKIINRTAAQMLADYKSFLQNFHGQSVTVLFDDDAVTYSGRCQVGTLAKSNGVGSFAVTVTCPPTTLHESDTSVDIPESLAEIDNNGVVPCYIKWKNLPSAFQGHTFLQNSQGGTTYTLSAASGTLAIKIAATSSVVLDITTDLSTTGSFTLYVEERVL